MFKHLIQRCGEETNNTSYCFQIIKIKPKFWTVNYISIIRNNLATNQ